MLACQDEILDAVVTGTRNVVEAAADAGVRRLVLSSTISAMYMDPRRDPEAPLDESSWSDLDYCKNTEVSMSSSSPAPAANQCHRTGRYIRR